MADVVPQGDRGAVAQIVDHADRGSVEAEHPPELTRLTDRTRGENSQQMAVREHEPDRRWA